jgi:hypothetical protein
MLTDENCTGYATRGEIISWAESVLSHARGQVMTEAEGGPPAEDNWLLELCEAMEALLTMIRN